MKQVPAGCRHWLIPALMGGLALLPGLVQAGNLGVAAKVGTLGYGGEIDYVLTDHFSLRGQLNSFSYDDTFDENDIDYDGSLELDSYGLLLDWHPFGGAFRLTAGGFNVDNKVAATAEGVGDYEIGDTTYTVNPGDTLQLRALMELGDGFKPYAGFGWGHSPANKGGLLLSFDIGILFQGSPSVDLQATGTATAPGVGTVDLGTDPTAQAEVAKEEQQLEDDIKDYDLYPVVSFGIGWRF